MSHEKDRDALIQLLGVLHSPLDILHLILPRRLAIPTAFALVPFRVLAGQPKPTLVEGEDRDTACSQ